MKNTKEIFFASDTNYLPYLSCAISSLSEHASGSEHYNIHILTTDFSAEALSETKKLIGSNITVTVHDLSEKIASIKAELAVRLRDYYSDSIYYRIFIPNMFPKLEKAVYLDADIILNDDVANLYDIDLGDNLIGAVTDESVVGIPVFCDYVKRQIGLERASDYFNSGVLLMNLDAMREIGLEEKFVYLLKTFNFDTVAPDQDYLNLLCHGRVHYLDRGWNKHPIAGNEIAREDLHLMHYNMFNKPWHYYGVENEDLFWNTAKRTPFAAQLAVARRSYTDKERNADLEGAKRLLLSAQRIAEGSVFMIDAFCHIKNG